MSGSRLTAQVYSIPPGAPFLDALADGVLATFGGGSPLDLARVRILLPTRRACRDLGDAFLRRRGQSLLLPGISPLGDLDEDEAHFDNPAGGGTLAADLPPAIAPMERRLLLTRLILQWGERRGRSGRDAVGGQGARGAPRVDQAALLADALGRLLDQVATEELSFDRLAELAPERFASHWQLTLDFLRLLTEAWPAVLAERGQMDATSRQVAGLRQQAARWRATPPDHPVIIAGSTGSVPATRALMGVVAGLAQGCLVLPGLDTHMDDNVWAALEPTHPQFGLKELLASLSVAGRPATRGDVAAWPLSGDLAPAAPERSRLLSQALLPAASVGDWEALRAMDGACLSRVVRVDCRTSREEAGVIALALRETLAVPDQTAALVTPDRTLARRVAVALARWDIQVDDSAGVPLAQTVPGVFVSLLATAMSEDMAPAPLLAVLKHPLAAGGETPVVFREAVRHMERCVLRGPRPAPGLGGVVASLRRLARQATAWRRTRDHDTPRAARDVDPAEMQALAGRMQHLKAAADPFARLLRRRRVMLADLLDAHLALAEALAATDSANGAARLWHGEAGQALAAFLADLRGRSAVLGPVSGAHYSHLLAALLAGQAVRLAGRSHPRLAILGLLEARLARYDRMILGGLNEGTWPGEPAADPWMSRPMRQSFGLPAAERRIGLAAHDFTQAFAAPDVILTRAERVDGQPTVPSRWLTRLDAALQGGGMADGLTKDASVWRDWVRQLDDPALAVPALAAGESRPAPTPPVAARPRRLSVTAVETWRDNPYAVYARYVLRLRPLDPLDGEPGAADRGIIIHRVLDRFMARVSETGWPGDPVSMLLAMGEDAFADLMDRPSVRAFWWPRFRRVANWFALEEGARRSSLSQTWSEAEGRLVLAGPAGDFTLTARADRIDRLSDGTLTIIDYKTGSAPSTKKVAALVAPQLPLEATIAEAGGFAGDGGRGPAAGPVSTLAYWKLTGGAMPGRVQTIDAVQHDLAARARLMLSRRIALYDRVEQPYTARQSRTPAAMDYDHLARRKAWLLAQDLGDGRDGTDNGENEGGS